MSSNARKLRAIAITALGVMATNIAISFASDVAANSNTPKQRSEVRTSGAPVTPNPPRPIHEARSSGAPVTPNPPRP